MQRRGGEENGRKIFKMKVLRMGGRENRYPHSHSRTHTSTHGKPPASRVDDKILQTTRLHSIT